MRFTSDGQYMAMAETCDFVHVYDVKQDFANAQEIDFFGDVSGISFSPDTESLFIGVAPHDRAMSTTLFWYDKCRNLGSYDF